VGVGQRYEGGSVTTILIRYEEIWWARRKSAFAHPARAVVGRRGLRRHDRRELVFASASTDSSLRAERSNPDLHPQRHAGLLRSARNDGVWAATEPTHPRLLRRETS